MSKEPILSFFTKKGYHRESFRPNEFRSTSREFNRLRGCAGCRPHPSTPSPVILSLTLACLGFLVARTHCLLPAARLPAARLPAARLRSPKGT